MNKKISKFFQGDRDKGYPKCRLLPLAEEGQTAIIKSFERQLLDSTYIALLLNFQRSHINVELCSSVKLIKYATKYINKGNNQAIFSIKTSNEVEQYEYVH